MTAITLNEKIKIRRDAEALKHRLNSFTEHGATCELCQAQVRFANGRVELDEALTVACTGATRIILKDAPLSRPSIAQESMVMLDTTQRLWVCLIEADGCQLPSRYYRRRDELALRVRATRSWGR